MFISLYWYEFSFVEVPFLYEILPLHGMRNKCCWLPPFLSAVGILGTGLILCRCSEGLTGGLSTYLSALRLKESRGLSLWSLLHEFEETARIQSPWPVWHAVERMTTVESWGFVFSVVTTILSVLRQVEEAQKSSYVTVQFEEEHQVKKWSEVVFGWNRYIPVA